MQLSHKLHSIFVWNCRTAVKPYKLAEISILFSKSSQNHLQSNAKKGILKEKRKKRTKRGSRAGRPDYPQAAGTGQAEHHLLEKEEKQWRFHNI